ncbi:Pkinase-domain-containing protein [Backusella circina FSU 941]|nr:Pkinase-domain-containing protein [Backusella circina FSU 941]
MTHLGSPLDIYNVIEQIGDGSFGTVHKAQHKQNKTLVALKLMKKQYSCIEDCQDQFEPKLLTLLPPHQNVIQFYDSFLAPTNDLSFIMEYSDGGNLYQLMRERKKVGLGFNHCELKNILYQILLAVSHIHRHHVFHRDMKPENLLVDYSTGKPTIKLADFGLAREVNSNPPFTEYVSTRWYRAPEVLLRSTEYSYPVDLWAIGAIFAELITLEPLFSGESEIDQIYKICEILGSPGNKVIAKRNVHNTIRNNDKKSHSPGFARKKQVPEQKAIQTKSTLSILDGGGEWKEGVRLAYKIGFQFPPLSPKPLESVIPHATERMLDLIRHFLFFNPSQRYTADIALKHSFFSESTIHADTVQEQCCPKWEKIPPSSRYGRLCSAIKENHEGQVPWNSQEARPIYSSHQKVHPVTDRPDSAASWRSENRHSTPLLDANGDRVSQSRRGYNENTVNMLGVNKTVSRNGI